MKAIKKASKQELLDNVVNEMNVMAKVRHPMLTAMHNAY